MSRSSGIGIIVWIYLIIEGDVVRGQLLQAIGGPNAVVLIKGQATLDCVTVLLAASSWIHTTDGSRNPLVIAVGCAAVTGNNAAYYRTELLGGNVCRLIIANVTMQQAGVYRCFDGDITTYRSLVTVIDPAASVVVYNRSEVVVGDQLNISCSINYSGPGPSSPAPSLHPSAYWTTSPGQIFTSAIYHPSINVVTLMATMTVQKPTVPVFQCNTVFEITGNTSGYNSTPPADSLTVGNTTELDVQYHPSTPNIANSGVACGSLTCNSSGNPPPNYKWFYWNKTVINVISEGRILTLTEVNQSYIICEAYNTIRNVNCNASTNYNVSQSDYCKIDANNYSPGKTDLITTIVPAAVLGGYGLCNIIATIVFLVYYNRKSNTVSDDKEMSTCKNKSKLNARFPWLQRMLPCMNESRENAGCTFLWVILFILMSILTGIIVFSILVAMVNCSRKRKNSKENSDIDMSNQKRSKTAGNPSSAAHGDFEDPYDEIRTMQPVRKHTLEEPTSAKNTNAKDAKKVFYTRVNPNLNTGEDIERYTVSMPGESPES